MSSAANWHAAFGGLIAVAAQTDGRTDKVNPVYNLWCIMGGGIMMALYIVAYMHHSVSRVNIDQSRLGDILVNDVISDVLTLEYPYHTLPMNQQYDHTLKSLTLDPGVGVGVGGCTRSENWWGCAAGRWPQKDRGKKWNLGPKRSNSVTIGSFYTPKLFFGVGGWEKVPQKDQVQFPECQKRGSKLRHIHITQHRGSTTPHPPHPTPPTTRY